MEQRKQRLRSLNIIVVLISTALTIGCGDGFNSAKSSSDTVLPSDRGLVFDAETTDPGEYLNEYLEELEAEVSEEQLSDFLSDDEFTLVDILSNFDVRFGNIARPLNYGAFLAEAKLSRKCHEGDYRYFASSRDYKCGELPIGEIIDEQTKKLWDYDVSQLSQVSGGVKYTVRGTDYQLFLDRKQYSSPESISLLDNKSNTTFNTGSGILDNVFFRLSPSEGDLNADVCFLSPGLRIHSNHQTVNVDAEKRFWFLKLRGKARITGNLGSLSFDSAKICATFKMKRASNGKMRFIFSDLQAPVFKNIKYTGVQIQSEVDGKGLLGILSNFVKIFGVNIEKKLEEMIIEKLKEIANENVGQYVRGDIETGKYIEKLITAEGYLDKLIKQVEDQTNAIIERAGPGSQAFFQAWSTDGCEVLSDKIEMTDLQRRHFLGICQAGLYARPLLFFSEPDSEAKGCYNHFFSVGNSDGHLDKWWGGECKIRNKIQVQAPKITVPLLSCLIDRISKDPKVLEEEGECDSELKLFQSLLDEVDLNKKESLVTELRGRFEELPMDGFQANLEALLERSIEDYL